MWEFIPQEAPSFLGGRDNKAIELANAHPKGASLLDGFQTSVGLVGLTGGLSIASWLVAKGVLAPSAIAAVGIMTYWSVESFAIFARRMAQPDPELEGRAASVTLLPEPDPEAPLSDQGLHISHLSVRTRSGQPLLNDVSFSAEPGTLIGVCGDSFAGKTMVLQAIAAPHDMDGLAIEGRVILNGANPWRRSGHTMDFTSVHVPPSPLMVPGGGANNLSCFGDTARLERARKILKSLVFTSDTVDRILAAQRAGDLSATEAKALSFARAFALRPRLYLFDRPEDGASDRLMGALANLAMAERKMGAVGIFVTDNRQLLEHCDKLLMLQNGRVIEFADASEVRERQTSGWAKFVTERYLDSEEALDAWLASHFRRDGDEGNRRAVCMIANEMLSVACMSPNEMSVASPQISFEFKPFAGHCILKISDAELNLSSGAMTKARAAAKTSVPGARLSPLAKVIRDSLEVEAEEHANSTSLTAKIKTYDPRKHTQRNGIKHEKTTG